MTGSSRWTDGASFASFLGGRWSLVIAEDK